jgi:hypothetical protein
VIKFEGMLTTKTARSMLGRLGGVRRGERQRNAGWPNLQKTHEARREQAQRAREAKLAEAVPTPRRESLI